MGVRESKTNYQRFKELEIGRLYIPKVFGGVPTLAWPESWKPGLLIELSLEGDLDWLGLELSIPLPERKRQWAKFLVGEDYWKVCRGDEDHPWSVYLELLQ